MITQADPISMDIELLATDEYPGSAYFVIDAKTLFGTKARVPIKLYVDGLVFRTSLAPMSGTHMAVFNRQMRESTGFKAGDVIHVLIELDKEERKVEVPADVETALREHGLLESFGKFSYSHQKEVMDWINDAKKPETRARRIAKLCEKYGPDKEPAKQE